MPNDLIPPPASASGPKPQGESASLAGNTPLPRPGKRWRRRLVITGVVVLVLIAAHQPILTFVGGLLVVDDPLEPAAAVVIMGASSPYSPVPINDAADLYNKKLATKILLIEDRSSRLVRFGILPTLETILRRELPSHGVPPEALTVIPLQDGAAWDGVRKLGEWLESQPQARVTMLANEFASRTDAVIVRSALEASVAGRVRFHALPDRRYTAADWWHTRQGISAVVGSYVQLGHTYITGEPEWIERWDPDEYERRLTARAALGPPTLNLALNPSPNLNLSLAPALDNGGSSVRVR